MTTTTTAINTEANTVYAIIHQGLVTTSYCVFILDENEQAVRQMFGEYPTTNDAKAAVKKVRELLNAGYKLRRGYHVDVLNAIRANIQ